MFCRASNSQCFERPGHCALIFRVKQSKNKSSWNTWPWKLRSLETLETTRPYHSTTCRKAFNLDTLRPLHLSRIRSSGLFRSRNSEILNLCTAVGLHGVAFELSGPLSTQKTRMGVEWNRWRVIPAFFKTLTPSRFLVVCSSLSTTDFECLILARNPTWT